MLNIQLLALAALSVPALADLTWYSATDCTSGFINSASFNCGLGCTQITDPTGSLADAHSVAAGGLEPNTQVVLYTSSDCSGDAYTAIGDAYGSPVADDQCVASTKDTIKSFQVLVYSAVSGGGACPSGTLTAATTSYPSPTG